jgi:hypothetical protein
MKPIYSINLKVDINAPVLYFNVFAVFFLRQKGYKYVNNCSPDP